MRERPASSGKPRAAIVELLEQGEILVENFAEAEAWIEDDSFASDVCRERGLSASSDFTKYECDNFIGCERGQRLPFVRATAGVHQDYAAVERGACCGHRVVPEKSADIVDDLRAGFDG